MTTATHTHKPLWDHSHDFEIEVQLDSDHRNSRERFRIYRVRDGGSPQLLATTPEKEGIGTILFHLHAEETITANDRVGVLDGDGTPERLINDAALDFVDYEDSGVWIVNPFAKG